MGRDAMEYGKWVQTLQWYAFNPRHFCPEDVLRMDAACPSETLEPSYLTHSVTSLKIAIPMMTFRPCCMLTPDLSCSNMKATHTQNKKLISERMPENMEVL